VARVLVRGPLARRRPTCEDGDGHLAHEGHDNAGRTLQRVHDGGGIHGR